VTKKEFLMRWAKKASQGGAAEAFERDVETMIHSAIRVGASVVTNGLIEGSKKLSKADREFIIKLASEATKAVDRGIRKLYE
jgi:hypothetical protein